MEEKRTRIQLDNGTEMVLLWTRPTSTANWVCQSTDECLLDMVANLEKHNAGA